MNTEPNEKKVEYPCYCMHCCQETHPLMLTGYCLKSLECDRCKQVSDLAIVKMEVRS